MAIVDRKRKKIEAEKKRQTLEAKKKANLEKKIAAQKEAEKVKAESLKDTYTTQIPAIRDKLCTKGGFHVVRITINKDNGLADFTFFESKKLINEFLNKGGE